MNDNQKNIFYKILKKPEVLIFILIFIIKLVYFFCLDFQFTPDSYEYIARNGFSVFLGEIDRYRLPIYPMLIDICIFFFDNNYLIALCLIQLLVSFLSIILVYITMKNLTSKRWLSLTIATLYGLSNAVIGWDKTILTESLSLSLTVIIAWGVISYLKKGRNIYIVAAVVAVTIGCFLRAVFAIYAGLIFGFLILRLIFPGKHLQKNEVKLQRIKDAKCFGIALIPIVLLMCYAGLFFQQFGAFTLSDSALGQQLSVVFIDGYYKDAQDEEIKAIAESILNSKPKEKVEKEIENYINTTYINSTLTTEEKQKLLKVMLEYYDEDRFLNDEYEQEMNTYFSELYGDKISCNNAIAFYIARCYIMNNFSRERINAFIRESKSANIKPYIINTFIYSLDNFASYEEIPESFFPKLFYDIINYTLLFIHISLLQGMVIGFIELLIYFAVLIKKHRVEWIHLGLSCFILFTGVLSIFGTNAEFARTALTMVPFIFISIGLWLNLICSKIKH